MIINQTAVAPTMSNVGETAKATIKASARLFKFFSDMVYADKFVAIWRELVANGMDAHVDAKNTGMAVVVTLPTTFTPFAKVRDYGTGMAHDFLMNQFMAYTDASTKDKSNEMIGGFGIGSKAPLAYTEQFAIHSYQDGKVRIYSVFKDDEDCPAIAFLSENDTTEPNGVEISFPVEQTDITKFKEAALKSLNYFDPLPTLINTTDTLEAPDYTVRTEGWGFRKGKTESQIVQGGIAYPIDKESVPRSLHEILGFGIDFYVPIGSVGIALSRERLSYDDATIRILTSLCDGIRPKIKEYVTAMFAGYATKWEAQVAFHEAVHGNTAAGRMIESLAEYKGEKLNRYIDPVMQDKVLIAFVSGSRYSKFGTGVHWTAARANPSAQAWLRAFCPRDIQHLVIDDRPTKPILRLRNLLESVNQNDGVMFVRKKPDRLAVPGSAEPAFVNDLDWDDFIKALGNPKVTMLSTLEPAIVTRNGTSLKRVEKIRGYKAARGNASFVDTLPVDGGYYIEMDRFSVIGISNEEREALDTEGKELLYFNKGDCEKVKKLPNWISAKDKVAQQLKAYKQAHPKAALAEAVDRIKNPRHYNYNNSQMRQRLLVLLDNKNFACPKRGTLAKLSTLYGLVKADLTHKDRAMRQLLDVKCEKQTAMLEALFDEIKNVYIELRLAVCGLSVSDTNIPVFNKLLK